MWAAALADCSPSDILDFSASINPRGPPQVALEAIYGHLNDLRAYPDPSYQRLRQVLAQVHGLPEDWLLPGNGVAELLTWAGRELAQTGVTHLLVPAFRDYQRALLAFAGEICPLRFEFDPQHDGPLDLGMLCPDLSGPGHRLVNNPHNPTGCLFSADSIIQLLDRFDRVVVDEAFMDFLPPDRQQSVIPQVGKYENLVVLRSQTKFYSVPGLRLGYAISAPACLQRWQSWRDPWSVNALADAVGQAVMTDHDFPALTWNWLPTARQQLFDGLAALPGLTPLPGAANFLLVAAQVSVTDLQRQLLQADQILIRDCQSFPELGNRYFRVAVRTDAENQRLLAALAQVLPHVPILAAPNP